MEGSPTHFHCAIRKYGVESFKWEILEEGWDPEIGKNIREPHWISVLNPEYNETKGGDGSVGIVRSEEAKKKTGDSLRGRKRGPLSLSRRNAHSIKMTGKTYPPYSVERRKRIGDGNRGRVHKKVLCPHCGATGGINCMTRWHFNNCKRKPL
jgi:hypothetical protein